MGTSSTAINAIIDALKSDLETATTLGLGASPTVYERDEEPAQIERENLPCAFMVPIVEEGCTVDMNMPWFPADFDFGITVMAFYKGNGDTPTDLQTDLRSIRDYSFNFVDYYRTKTGGAILNRGSIRNIRLDQGYWISGGGNIFHFWTAKLDITMKI